MRRAALKKLFSDPHFNVMDGLDVYIDDYSKTEPIPPAMLAGLRQAQKILQWAKEDEEERRQSEEPQQREAAASAEQPSARAAGSVVRRQTPDFMRAHPKPCRPRPTAPASRRDRSSVETYPGLRLRSSTGACFTPDAARLLSPLSEAHETKSSSATATARCRSTARRSRARSSSARLPHGAHRAVPPARRGIRGRGEERQRPGRRLHAGGAAVQRAARRAEGQRRHPVRQHPRDRRLVGGGGERDAQDRGAAGARRSARARAGAGRVVPVGGRAADRRPGGARAAVGGAARRASCGVSRAADRRQTQTAAELPAERRYPVWSGRDRAITGYLGAFEVEWEQANPIDLEACTRCNACIQVCPEQAIDYSLPDRSRQMQGAPQVRDGLRRNQGDRFRARGNPPQRALRPGARSERPRRCSTCLSRRRATSRRAATRWHWRARCASSRRCPGEFEKPKFFEYKEKICAHGRSEIIGCTHCIDVCSTRAITSELGENRVKVEPHLCMGCGGCATVCPSGAMTYAYPRVADMGTRLKTVLQTYREAGGEDACLLFHSGGEGRELIARLGAARQRAARARDSARSVSRRLARARPHARRHRAGRGAVRHPVRRARSRRTTCAALERQMGYAQEIVSGLGLGEGRFRLIEARDVGGAGAGAVGCRRPPRALAPATFNLSNEKRATLDFIFDHLLRQAPVAQGGSRARGGRALRRGHRGPAEMHHVPRLRRRLSGGRLARREGQAAAEVHRAQLRAVRLVREDLPRGRDHARAAAAAHGRGDAGRSC